MDRPWGELSEEIEEFVGPSWADYAAWELWINDKNDWLSRLSLTAQVDLYSSMCSQIDQAVDEYEMIE